ncbi:MAG: hypothetical protein L0213_01280, partial [Candidatus Dadabacteria bacterium]|nr:hypothetical protein [Candidatus Dadabacteria bacterium]
FEYDVEVIENGSSTRHKVRVGKEDYEKLTGGRVTPGTLVEKSFEFLLEREPKESILRSFDLNVISKYFSDYPRLIQEYF